MPVFIVRITLTIKALQSMDIKKNDSGCSPGRHPAVVLLSENASIRGTEHPHS